MARPNAADADNRSPGDLENVAHAAGASSRSKRTPHLPPELAAVQLVDARTSAAVGAAGATWWLSKVASGEAPAPVIRAARFTRWRMADVADFWARFGQPEGAAADRSMDRAKVAGAASVAKRRAGVAL